jgi:hypothetical protein
VVVDQTGEIFGDVPNVAARALAEPGTVAVTMRVQRQIAGLFVAEERGSHELKGVPEPVTLFRIVRASGGGRRAGQRHFTPLVGREEEISMLLRRWERAQHGDGQLVLSVGEPGLGKPAMGPVRAQRCPVRLHALRTAGKRIQRPSCSFLAPFGAEYARRAAARARACARADGQMKWSGARSIGMLNAGPFQPRK